MLNPPEAYQPNQVYDVTFLGEPALPVTYWSWTLSMQTHDVPAYWLKWINEFVQKYCLAALVSIERGGRNQMRHLQAVVKMHWWCDDGHSATLSLALRALLKVAPTDNRYFCVKPFEKFTFSTSSTTSHLRRWPRGARSTGCCAITPTMLTSSRGVCHKMTSHICNIILKIAEINVCLAGKTVAALSRTSIASTSAPYG